jgi:antitoxin PrlF
MAASTLTSKGQITIPKDVRTRLGVQEGDRLVFQFDEHGRLILRPEAQDSLGGLIGLLRHRAKERPATVEEMNEAVRTRAAEKYGTSRKP